MWKWMGLSVPEKKSSFEMLGLTFSSKLNLSSYIISLSKTASKKNGTLICSMKFLSLEVALYLYSSTIWPSMEYCFHVWTGAPSCYLELMNMQNCWSFTWFPLLNHWLTFGKCSSELAEPVQLPYSQERSTHYSDRLHAWFFCHHSKMLQGCLCQQFLS